MKVKTNELLILSSQRWKGSQKHEKYKYLEWTLAHVLFTEDRRNETIEKRKSLTKKAR